MTFFFFGCEGSVQNILLTWHLNFAADAILVVEGPLGFLVSISGPQRLLPQLSLTIALFHQLPIKIYKKSNAMLVWSKRKRWGKIPPMHVLLLFATDNKNHLKVSLLSQYPAHNLEVHYQFPHIIVTMLWQNNDNVVTILSPTSGTSRRLQNHVSVNATLIPTQSLCVTGYLLSAHVVIVQLPTRCLVAKFLHRPNGSGYPVISVPDEQCSLCPVVTVLETKEQWPHCHSGSHYVVSVQWSDCWNRSFAVY